MRCDSLEPRPGLERRLRQHGQADGPSGEEAGHAGRSFSVEEVCARVPELADQTDPVLVRLERLLDDDALSQPVRHDVAQRYRLTLVQGRHATPAAVLLRLLVVPHLDAGSSADTVERVADWLVVRWCCRVEFPCVPDTATLLRWAATVRPETLQALTNRAAQLAKPAKVTRARTLRIASTGVQMPLRPLAG